MATLELLSGDEAPAAKTPTKRGKKRSAAAGQPSKGGISELTNELWQAAVELRGSIDVPDYKRYVLPLIFLRFLSLRYERRRAELEALIADPKSDYYGDEDALHNPDEYRSAGAFVVPEEARWVNIVRSAQADDIKVRMDEILELLETTYPDKLRGLLPRVFAGSNMEPENLRGLINLFAKDIFAADHGGEDLIGRIYEYFIGEFASTEGKRGGEYFTPSSIVKLLVAMLEPTEGVVFDPCCGSGGMFVQSDLFTNHNHRLSFVGQESKDFTYRLCRMNLFIHGIDGNIQPGNSYWDDRHPGLQADYIMANPPFNDGAKAENGWGADRIPANDPRLMIDDVRMPLPPRNANPMWILHFLHHLKEGGTAGFVMATGELSNGEIARSELRKALVESGYVDCIVQLSGQLFANTQIPCSLWFLSKNRDGTSGWRERREELLFIDARRLGTLIPGSRKQKQLSADDLHTISSVYQDFRTVGHGEPIKGFTGVVNRSDVRERRYSLTPGRYVGSSSGDDEETPFDERFPRLLTTLRTQFDQSSALSDSIQLKLQDLL